jgi:hypothetical protein
LKRKKIEERNEAQNTEKCAVRLKKDNRKRVNEKQRRNRAEIVFAIRIRKQICKKDLKPFSQSLKTR